MSADMRGNTDETWSRTLDWLVRNRLLAPAYGLQHLSERRTSEPPWAVEQNMEECLQGSENWVITIP